MGRKYFATNDTKYTQNLADYAVDTLGYKKIAVLYNVADEYSTGGLCIEFADGASERGGE